MRIGTWNCRLNLDGKRSAFERLGLDVAVVPESAESPALASEQGVTHFWTGRNTKKGLGVFAFSPWSIHPIVEADPFPWCLPVKVHHADGRSFILLAVWTVKSAGDERPSYAGQMAAVINRWKTKIEHEPVVIAGDINASFQGPSIAPHTNNVDLLASIGTHSAYQLVHGPVTPDDEPPTLRWIGPGSKPYHYHCDYIFVSAVLAHAVRSAEVGSMSDWVDSGLSDHCPVVAEIADDAAPITVT